MGKGTGITNTVVTALLMIADDQITDDPSIKLQLPASLAGLRLKHLTGPAENIWAEKENEWY